MQSLEALAGLTARLASTVRLDEVVEVVLHEISALGFGTVWLAVLDQQTGLLSTIKKVIDGVDTTHEMPRISANDLRLPIGRGFRERRMFSVADPGSLHIIEHDDDPVPANELALPRVVHDRMRDRPFACGPLLGRRGEPVGALGLSSYLGNQPIPDSVVSQGLVRVFTDHLGIAMERALHVAHLDDSLSKARVASESDARIKAVGELTAEVAHDINNLAWIALFSVSVGSRSSADAIHVLPGIERATRAIGDLVARLQRTARSPSLPGDELADVTDVIEDILLMTKPLLRELLIEVGVDVVPVPLVRCDAMLLHRVLLNLLRNAHDALADVPVDRRRIQIQVRPDGRMVHVTFADTGPGIAPQMLDRLFQPFATTKGGAHQGLGLSAAHALLHQVGGQLTAHNAPTGGAVFEIALVAAPPDARINPPAAVPIVPPAPPAGPGKILAVDDDPDVVYIIRAFLEPLGYEVVTATGPVQALEVASSRAFDLVLCDIGLPGQSGLDMPRALRDRGYRGKLILMTGWDSHALSADPRLAECDALLKKPFVGVDLINAIRSLIATDSAAT